MICDDGGPVAQLPLLCRSRFPEDMALIGFDVVAPFEVTGGLRQMEQGLTLQSMPLVVEGVFG